MHLLATETATLDEIDAAVDLEQSPADIVVLSFSDSDLSALAAAWSTQSAALPTLRLASLKQLRHPMSVDLYADRVLAHARLVIVRALGGLDYWRYGFETLSGLAAKHGIKVICLPGDDRPDPRLTEWSSEPPEVVEIFDQYFRHGGVENLANALRFGAHLLERTDRPQPPKPLGAAIGFRRDGTTTAVSEGVDNGIGQPAALIVFYRSSLLAADTSPVTALMDALDGQGLEALAVAVTSLKDPAAADQVAAMIERIMPAIILNATAFSALREDESTVLDTADCPVLQVALAGNTQEAWAGSNRGLSPIDLAMNVVLPELDGRVFTRAISFKADRAADPRLEYSCTHHASAPDRIAFVARLAAAWARLGQTPRDERRVALMLSDYPARGGRTGYACGLDTGASVVEIVRLLAAEGYDCDSARLVADGLIDRLTAAGASETISVPIPQYQDWIAAWPETAAAMMTATWGEPLDDPAVSCGNFHFPCVRAGNVLIVLQPDRGSQGDRKPGYHDGQCPPRHSYAALYAWLREREKIHALVHVGTHGTLEWLPGKALALSDTCYPEAVLGPVPVIYPFIVNNPGEAVQAKRRISAVTIGHLTPPLCEAGLHGPLAELEGLIEEYAQAVGADSRRARLLEAEIIERAWRSGLARDCGLTTDDTAGAAIAKLDAQLCDIKDLAIRDQLHVFGVGPDPASVERQAMAIARNSDCDVVHILRSVSGCAAAERTALIAALDGRRVAPGPSGAPTRGRFDVLPTGRNLNTIDPRAIPTRTAAVIGARAADEVIRRHLQDHGDYPRALLLDLWAAASLRTGGDDLAQALSYIGARPVWDGSSQRVTGVEVMPLAKLDRPRIDTTLRVSGLFRDIFAAQIALFDLAVELVASRDEEDAWNPLAAARRKRESLARTFSSAPGTYGAGTAELVLDGQWSTEADAGRAYLAATTHAYGLGDMGVLASSDFAARVAAADALVHPQDDRERDILDGDGVADFAGGFAAAAALAGRTPALYHLDSSRPDTPVARTMAEEITRIVRGRLTNPHWIAGMLRHGHRGVAEIAQGIDALYAFAATARVVPGHLFDSVHDALFGDVTTRAALEAANPAAMTAMADRLEDALARGLWNPRRNAVHAELACARGPRPATSRSAPQLVLAEAVP